MGGDRITIPAFLDTTGFQKGTQQLTNAVKSMGNSVKRISSQISRTFNGMMSPIKKLMPLLIGVGSAYGVISKAVNTFMSENVMLQEQMKAVWRSLGNLLGPIITQIVSLISSAVSYFIAFLNVLGLTSKTASQLSKQSQQSAQALQKTIAGFDELNVLQRAYTATLQDKELPDWLKELVELLKNKLWDEAANLIIDKMDKLINTFKSKTYEFGEKCSEYLYGALHIIGRVIDEVDWAGIGEGLANFINGLVSDERISGEDLGKILVGKFTIAFKILTGFLETLDLGRIGEILSGVVRGALNSFDKAIREADFEKIGQNIKALVENIDWAGITTALGNLLIDVWNGALDILQGRFGEENGEELSIVKSLRSLGEALQKLCEAITPVITDLWENYLQPFSEWLVNSALADAIQTVADRISDLADLINGDINFAEFVAGMSSIEVALSGIVAIIGTIKALSLAEGIIKIASKFETLKEAIGAVFGTSSTFAGIGMIIGGAITAITSFFSQLKEGFSWVKEILMVIGIALAAVGAVILGAPALIAAVIAAIVAAVATAVVLVKEHWEEIKEFFKELWESIKEWCIQAWEDIKEAWSSAGEFFKGIGNSIKEGWSQIKSWISEKWNSIAEWWKQTAYKDGKFVITWLIDGLFEKAKNLGTWLQNNVSNKFSSTLSGLISSAKSWGRDLIQNFINGLADRVSALWESCRNIAQGIREFLGFSEPEEGPLSDFHTYAPDMIDLFTKGINENKGKTLNAVSELADGISSCIQDGDYSFGSLGAGDMGDFMDGFADKVVNGFSDMVTRMQQIADQVVFSMPTVAGGGFLPYNVSSESSSGSSSEENSQILLAIGQMQDTITRFESAVDNMQWVIKFGNVRAVVEEITKVQKQIERAKGAV